MYKCDNCDEEPSVLLELWLPVKKKWGTEWVKKKVCPTCWDVIIAGGDLDVKEDSKVYQLTKEQRTYICANLCNLKECPKDCPLYIEQDSYELDTLDIEDICGRCRNSLKGCDAECPIKKQGA